MLDLLHAPCPLLASTRKMKSALGCLFWVLSVFPFQTSLACSSGSVSVLLLAPLSGESSLGGALWDGLVEGDHLPLEQQCETSFTYLDTEDESTTFIEQWYQAVEAEPDLLIGPLLPEHQEQLRGLSAIDLPEKVVWLYPGDLSQLAVDQTERLFTISLGWREILRGLLEFGWDQGQHDLALLLPNSDQGEEIAEHVVVEWEGRGGAVVAVAHYGPRFSDLNVAMRRLVQQSGGEFDLLLTTVDDPRLRMLRPLMSYHSREEPIYSITPPLGNRGLKKDLEGIVYPMQPALLERGYQDFEVDDFLLQIENIGTDLMAMVREGFWFQEAKGRFEERGSYFGRAGRYSVEGQRVNIEPCIVQSSRGKMVPLYCPESEKEAELSPD